MNIRGGLVLNRKNVILSTVTAAIAAVTLTASAALAWQPSPAIQTNEVKTTEQKNSYEAPGKELPIAAEPMSIAQIRKVSDAKENIYNNILNSVQFYNTVKGSFKTTFISQLEEAAITYQVSYEQITTSTIDTEQYSANRLSTNYDNVNKWYLQFAATGSNEVSSRKMAKVANIVTNSASDEQRVTVDERGDKHYLYTPDLTNTSNAKLSLHAQDLAFCYLEDFSKWDIENVTEYAERPCIVLAGTADEYYTEKLGIASFEMYVDAATGIVLKFEGFSQDGEISQYIRTDSIKINDSSIAARAMSSNSINFEEKYAGYKNRMERIMGK